VAFGVLLFWAWPSLRAGSFSRSVPALIVGAFYLITGTAAYGYSGREPFWLLFVVQGVIVISSTLVLGGGPGASRT
jgi:nitric oxide reductase large subunit